MRLVGRYFAIGAMLGSVSGLVALVLIWTWMSVHLGIFGFMIGWIPAGLVAALLWVAMVVLWGPILIVGVMLTLALILIRGHGWRRESYQEPPAISEPDQRPPPADAETPRDREPRIPDQEDAAPPPPPPEPGPPPDPPTAERPRPPAPPRLSREPPPALPSATPTSPRLHPSEDLSGDAAAAGDTSHKPPR